MLLALVMTFQNKWYKFLSMWMRIIIKTTHRVTGSQLVGCEKAQNVWQHTRFRMACGGTHCPNYQFTNNKGHEVERKKDPHVTGSISFSIRASQK